MYSTLVWVLGRGRKINSSPCFCKAGSQYRVVEMGLWKKKSTENYWSYSRKTHRGTWAQRIGDKLQRMRGLEHIHPWQWSLYLSSCFCSCLSSQFSTKRNPFENLILIIPSVCSGPCCDFPCHLIYNPHPCDLASHNCPTSFSSPPFFTKDLSATPPTHPAYPGPWDLALHFCCTTHSLLTFFTCLFNYLLSREDFPNQAPSVPYSFSISKISPSPIPFIIFINVIAYCQFIFTHTT